MTPILQHGHASSMAAVLLLAVLPLILCVGGCSFFQKAEQRPPGYMATQCRTGNVLHDLRNAGSSLLSMDASARIQIEFNGRKQPSVSCAIKWCAGNSGADSLRVTGRGPLGITYFHALLVGDRFFLYIPSHNTVYVSILTTETGIYSGNGSASFELGGYHLDQAVVDTRKILNPWSVLSTTKIAQVPCPPEFQEASVELACYSSVLGQVTQVSAFSTLTLSPLSILSRGYSLNFRGVVQNARNAPPCLNYPSVMELVVKKWNLKLKAEFKDISFNTVSPGDPSFDIRPFEQIHTLPIEFLLSRN